MLIGTVSSGVSTIADASVSVTTQTATCRPGWCSTVVHTAEVGVQTDSIFGKFEQSVRQLFGMQVSAHVVQKFPKITVPSPDSFVPDLSKIGVTTALPTGCKHVGNIESLRLQTICDQFLHEGCVGAAVIEGEIPRSGGSRAIAGATPRSSTDTVPNKNQLRAGHDAIGTLLNDALTPVEFLDYGFT